MTDDSDKKRQVPRRPTRSPVPVRIGSYKGRLLDVSEFGLRFAVNSPPDRDVPVTVTVVVGEPGSAVPVRVVWTSYEAGMRLCGCLIAPHGLQEWRRFVATV